MDWKDFSSILNTASAVVVVVASVYLARFEYRLLEKLNKKYYPLPMEPEDYPFTRREAKASFEAIEGKIETIQHVDRDQWVEINRIRESKKGTA